MANMPLFYFDDFYFYFYLIFLFFSYFFFLFLFSIFYFLFSFIHFLFFYGTLKLFSCIFNDTKLTSINYLLKFIL
jgi:hypothetical protein